LYLEETSSYMQQNALQSNINNAFISNAPIAQWFVVYTKPQAEKRVAERLQLAGFEVYLPLFEELKQWSDRKKKVQRPLISSVVFVRTIPTQLFGVFEVQGVSRILRFLGKPAVVQHQEILNLQILLQQANLPVQALDKLEPGMPVEVLRGPFKGIIGAAVKVLNTLRVQIDIRHLGVAFHVNVPRSFVRTL
jgi:transcription antitermination factor NusG